MKLCSVSLRPKVNEPLVSIRNLSTVAKLWYPAPWRKMYFLPPPTKTAEFKVKNSRKTAEAAKAEPLLLLLLFFFKVE